MDDTAHANFIASDPLKTPEHIAPVWYFTPFYAILRAVPDKLMGVGAMGVQHNTRYGARVRGVSALQQARYSTARLVRGGSGASTCWIMPK